MSNKLSDWDFDIAAAVLGCDTAAIKAVCDVEAPQGGFLPDGRLRILFEGHHFHKHTGGKYSKAYPDISYPKWDATKYRGPAGERQRFSKAFGLDAEAAMKSASIGRFQILGANYAECGYTNVGAFWTAMQKGEDAHLIAFCRFVKFEELHFALRAHDWAAFARSYNGPGYKKNQYDTKLAAAYKKHAGG